MPFGEEGGMTAPHRSVLSMMVRGHEHAERTPIPVS